MKPIIIKIIIPAAVIFTALLSAVNVYASADPDYVLNYRDKLAIKTFFSESFTSLRYRGAGSKEYKYTPNIPIAFGAGISWGGITLTGSTGLDFLRNKDKGDTEFVDLQGYYFKRKLVLSFFLQSFKGVYYEENDNIHFPRRDDDTYILRPDIEMIRMGGYLEYLFNGNRFSYSSAFNQKEKQLRSSGSFLLGLGLYYDRVKSERSFIPQSSDVENNKISTVQFGPTVGYAYNVIIKKYFFISGSLSLGANVAFGIINSEREDLRIFPMFLPKFAMGYSKENWGINLTYVNNQVEIIDNDSQEIYLSSGKFMLTYSHRFNFDPKISRKFKRIFFKNPDGEEIHREILVRP